MKEVYKHISMMISNKKIESDLVEEFVRKVMPSGSGLDNGINIIYNESESNKIVLKAPYHPMNEHGYYDPWVDLKIHVKPDFISGIDISFSYSRLRSRFGGLGMDDLLEYLDDIITEALLRNVNGPYFEDGNWVLNEDSFTGKNNI